MSEAPSPTPATPGCSPTWCAPTATTTARSPATATRPGAVRILARTHQQLIWDRVRQTNRLRNALREYFPGALEAFPKLAHGDAVGVLSSASGPREAARLSISQIRSALRARRPPAQHRAPRRRGPRGVALPAARGAARSEQGRSRQVPVRPSGRSARSTVRSRSSRPSSRPLLSSTRTPASTVPCPVSVWSRRPGARRVRG